MKLLPRPENLEEPFAPRSAKARKSKRDKSGGGWLADWSSVLATLLIAGIGAVIYITMRKRSPGMEDRALTRPETVVGVD